MAICLKKNDNNLVLKHGKNIYMLPYVCIFINIANLRGIGSKYHNDIETLVQLTVGADMVLSIICHTTWKGKNLAAETTKDSGQFNGGCNSQCI